MGKKLEQALAEAGEIEAAEADQTDRPIPSHVNVSRPNRARSRVLQVRLTSDEFDALERIAQGYGLPVSTVARERLLGLIAEGRSGAERAADLGDVAAVLRWFADEVSRRPSASQLEAALGQWERARGAAKA